MPLCPAVAGGMHRLPELNTLLRALTLVAEAMVLQGSLTLRARNARLPHGADRSRAQGTTRVAFEVASTIRRNDDPSRHFAEIR